MRNGFGIARECGYNLAPNQSDIVDGFSSPGGGAKPGGKPMPGAANEVKSTFIGACSEASSGSHVTEEHGVVVGGCAKSQSWYWLTDAG